MPRFAREIREPTILRNKVLGNSRAKRRDGWVGDG